jgi:PAS domain S-box-containing protein
MGFQYKCLTSQNNIMKDLNDASSLNHFVEFFRDTKSTANEAEDNYDLYAQQDEINLFQFLVENSSDGLAWFEGEYLKYASPVYEKMLGYAITPEKFPTIHHLLEYVHPEDLHYVSEKIKQSRLSENSKITYEFRQQKSDGTYKWVENSVTCKFSGGIAKTYVISRDIDDRKEKEIVLRHSEERFRALFSQNVIGFVTTDLKGNIVDVNEMFANISGYTADSLKGKQFISLIHPDDKTSLSFILKTGISENEYPAEIRMKSKTGGLIWLETFANRIKYRNGTPDCLIIAINDITWRKEAEKVLHANRTMLEAISDNTTALIFAKDASGRFTFINKAFEESFDLQLSEVFGKTDLELFGEHYGGQYRANDLQVMAQKKSCIIEEEVVRNGKIMTALSVKVPLFSPSGKVTGICGIASDISKVKEKERELQEVISTKEKLLSIISHDLANPLNSLFGFAQLLKAGVGKTSPETTLRNIDMILKSSQAMTELVNTLQQWASLQRNKIKVSPGVIHVRQLVEKSFALLDSSARNKLIHLENKTGLTEIIFADEKMMGLVLRNIISNAIKFSNPNNTVTVDCTSDKEKISICIRDNGVGISEEKLKKLFDINTADSQPGTAGEKGTGLGLLICKEFVDLNGGKIQGNSRLNEGSEFCITMPRSC